MKHTLLRWHKGIGDALLCNGLVRTLVERGHNLALPFHAHNRDTIAAMFADIHPAVVLAEDVNYEDEIVIGYEGRRFLPDRFDESFYQQADVSFLLKWHKFSLPHQLFGEYQAPERFIHDDPARGFVIPIQDGYRPDPSQPFLSHLPYLLAAKEIHCINSCFAILADLMNARGKKFLHLYARWGEVPVMGRKWKYLYDPQ